MPAPVTPETLTDEMIEEALSIFAHSGDHPLVADCQLALRKRDRHWTRFQRLRQRSARVRIAAAINARAGKESK